MGKYGDKAHENFYRGYNCSQSVVLAFEDVLGLPRDTLLMLSSGFGAGFGRMREVCGAFSGITMVIGALAGNTDPAKKSETYARIQQAAAKFKEGNGRSPSIICREMLGLEKAEGTPVASVRTPEYYKNRPCAALCRFAADLAAQELGLDDGTAFV